MTTTRKLIALAALIADDLDVLAALPADRITFISIGPTEDDDRQRVRFSLPAKFEHPTAEKQSAMTAAATWLRETLPALAAEADATSVIDLRDDDIDEHYLPEHVIDILNMKCLVDADVSAYWRTAELDGVLDSLDITLMFTAAGTFGLAWADYLEKASVNVANSLNLASERINRHGDRIPA